MTSEAEAILDAAEVESLLNNEGIVKRDSLRMYLHSLAKELKKQTRQASTEEGDEIDVGNRPQRPQNDDDFETHPRTHDEENQWSDDGNKQIEMVETIKSKDIKLAKVTSSRTCSIQSQNSIRSNRSPQLVNEKAPLLMDQSHRVIWIGSHLDSASYMSSSVANLQKDYPYFLIGKLTLSEWEEFCNDVELKLNKCLDYVVKAHCLISKSICFGVVLFLGAVPLYIQSYINMIVLTLFLLLSATIFPMLFRRVFGAKKIYSQVQDIWDEIEDLCERASKKFDDGSGISFQLNEWKGRFNVPWKCIDCHILAVGEEIIKQKDSGILYIGEVKDDKPHGKGKLIKHDGYNFITFDIGEYKDGEKNHLQENEESFVP